MLKSSTKFFRLFLLGIFFIGCQNENDPILKSEFLQNDNYIQYGTSFNNCINYCRNTLTITQTEMELLKQGWDQNKGLPDIKVTKITLPETWQKIQNSIDLDGFLKLDSIIGCPDCADGGAEWIKIKQNDVNHKVVFDYGKEPESLKPLVELLRSENIGFKY